MLWIIGVVLLLIVGVGCIVGTIFLLKDEEPGLGFVVFLFGFLILLISYSITYDKGHGTPANPDDLSKKIIYMLIGKVETGTNENITILKDARGTIICIKTSALLPPGTDYVKRVKLEDDEVELAPVTKTSEKTPEE